MRTIWIKGLPLGLLIIMFATNNMFSARPIDAGNIYGFIKLQIDSLYGCTDPLALNYNPHASIDDSSCIYDSIHVDSLYGCTDPLAINYNPHASIDDSSCVYDSASVLADKLPQIANVSIYPVPIIDDLFISFKVNSPTAVFIEIYDQYGRRVFMNQQNFTTGFYRTKSKTGELPKGLYFVKVGNGKDFNMTRKILKD